jgi:UTP:GlnB (protein PII) uridylyltransferase
LFAALYHDICKPETKTVEPDGRIRFLGHEEKGSQAVVRRGIALRLSNGEIDFLRTVVKNHMRIHDFTYRLVHQNEQPTRRAVYRFFRDTGMAGVALALLALADTRATYEQTLPQDHWAACLDTCRVLLEAWYETSEQVVSPPSLVNGDDLMSELGLKPGRVLGKLLEAIREAQAEGIIISREQAIDFSRRWLAGQN